MKKAVIVWLTSLGLLLVGSAALAKDKPGKGKKSSAEPASAQVTAFGTSQPAVQVKWGFSDEERRVVCEYVQDYHQKGGGKSKQLPPGLAKKVARGGKLPPGWQQKCAVGEIMPPDVYDQCHPLPSEVVLKMPPPPEPTLTVTIGGKVVRLLKATREILDIFDVNVRF